MLAASHTCTELAKRKAKGHINGNNKIMYAKIEETLQLIICDIANGVSRSDCIQKVREGLYGNKPVGQRQSEFYYKAALDRIHEDRQEEVERLKDLMYTRYEALLADCIKENDRSNARAVLDSMAKLFIGYNEKQTNIQINSQDGNMMINFGFTNDN